MIAFLIILTFYVLVADVSKHWRLIAKCKYFFAFCTLFCLTNCFHVLYAQEESSKQALRNNKYKQVALNIEKLYANGELEEVIAVFKQACF